MNHRRLARELALLSFEFGITLNTEWKLEPVYPERPLSLVEREEAMEKNMATLSGISLPEAVPALRAANRTYAAREALLTVMRSDALEVERSEALVSLLRRDLDAHPMFTRVAGAESVEEIRLALAELEPKRHLVVRRPVGKFTGRVRSAKMECTQWARSVMGGFA